MSRNPFVSGLSFRRDNPCREVPEEVAIPSFQGFLSDTNFVHAIANTHVAIPSFQGFLSDYYYDDCDNLSRSQSLRFRAFFQTSKWCLVRMDWEVAIPSFQGFLSDTSIG